MYLKQRVKKWLMEAVKACQAEGSLPTEIMIDPELERPAQIVNGDFSTNVAMKLAKIAKKAPRQIAEVLVGKLKNVQNELEKIDVAGPGFVNLYLKPEVLLHEGDQIRMKNQAYGYADWGNGRKLLLEFVSANPVGPLNVVSARAAAVGDSLANILKSQGVEVCREYYVNDAGKQAMLLGKSCYVRWRQSLGEELVFPEDGYQGEYVKELAQQIVSDKSRELEKFSEEEAITIFWKEGVARMVTSHQQDLEAFGVQFDNWFSEMKLHVSQQVEQVVQDLDNNGYVYKKDDATWFRATDFSDDKDRVLKKADGYWAYIAADIAYHQDKFNRGFNELVDLWGPDHHGYIPRMKAAMQALGHNEDAFSVHIVQQVNLMEAGKQVAMSKRAGKFITMRELIDDVGKDVTRFFFLMRSTDAHLDFDLDLARKHSEDNPVYYIQYAYARICSILRKAESEGFNLPLEHANVIQSLEAKPEELALVRQLTAYPEILEVCARNLEPHALAFALRDMASAFHRFYTICRVLDEAAQKTTRIRLALVDATRIVLKNGLNMLGLDTPERM